MKKAFLILAAYAIVFASCSNGDAPERPTKKKNILGTDSIILKQDTGMAKEK